MNAGERTTAAAIEYFERLLKFLRRRNAPGNEMYEEALRALRRCEAMADEGSAGKKASP